MEFKERSFFCNFYNEEVTLVLCHFWSSGKEELWQEFFDLAFEEFARFYSEYGEAFGITSEIPSWICPDVLECARFYRAQLNYKHYVFFTPHKHIWGICQQDYDAVAGTIEEYERQKLGIKSYRNPIRSTMLRPTAWFSEFHETLFTTARTCRLHIVSPSTALERDFQKFPVTDDDKLIWDRYKGNSRAAMDKASEEDKITFMTNYLAALCGDESVTMFDPAMPSNRKSSNYKPL